MRIPKVIRECADMFALALEGLRGRRGRYGARAMDPGDEMLVLAYEVDQMFARMADINARQTPDPYTRAKCFDYLRQRTQWVVSSAVREIEKDLRQEKTGTTPGGGEPL